MSSSGFEDASNEGMKDFLRTLPEDEVYGLLKTTTGGLVAAENVKDAIDTIITYSDAITLLNRRRVKKDYLINYLHSKKIRFSLTLDKTKLCRTVLNFWGEQNCGELKFVDVEKPILKESKPNKCIASPVSKNKPPTEFRSTGSTTSLTVNKPTEPEKHEPISKPPISTESVTSQKNACESCGHCSDNKVALINNTSLDLEDTEEETMDYEESISLRQNELQLGQKLGEEFAVWFYQNLNGLLDFGPNHFWPQSNLRIEYLRNSVMEIRNVKEIRNDGAKCFTELCQLRNNHQIFFNPNLVPGIGVRGKINPHGLAQVMACGTLLRSGDVVGVFEQIFGLMMDPGASNNYKIKFCILKLREGNHIIKSNDPPALCDTSLVGVVEEVDDELGDSVSSN